MKLKKTEFFFEVLFFILQGSVTKFLINLLLGYYIEHICVHNHSIESVKKYHVINQCVFCQNTITKLSKWEERNLH